jgi:hypothetical protein
MGNLELGAFTAQNRKVLAPVELERFAGAESQRNEGAAPRSLLLALPLGPPLSRKGRHTVVGAGEAKSATRSACNLLQRLPEGLDWRLVRPERARRPLAAG